MFHKHKTQMAAITIAASLLLLPTGSLAQDMISSGVSPQTQSETLPATSVLSHTGASLKDMSFQDMRRETKAKISSTRAWAKNHTLSKDIKFLIQDMEKATDNFQDQVTPLGRPIKSFVSKKMPGKTLAYQSDRSFTVFGLMLILAFAFVILIMNLANPESRLGGRH